MNHQNVTTAFELPGIKVSRSLGVVRGITVRSRGVVGSIGANIQQIFGGNISLYTSLCEQARSEAYELMIRHADDIGADGIIGVRYDATELSQGVTEVLCYGTAVKLSTTG
ncbi:MAG: YbjQ family protein [Isosphaeraceae bacterium]